MKIIHTDAIFYWKFVNDLFEQITILFYRVVQPVSSSRIHQQLQNNVGGYKNMGSGINESCASCLLRDIFSCGDNLTSTQICYSGLCSRCQTLE